MVKIQPCASLSRALVSGCGKNRVFSTQIIFTLLIARSCMSPCALSPWTCEDAKPIATQAMLVVSSLSDHFPDVVQCAGFTDLNPHRHPQGVYASTLEICCQQVDSCQCPGQRVLTFLPGLGILKLGDATISVLSPGAPSGLRVELRLDISSSGPVHLWSAGNFAVSHLIALVTYAVFSLRPRARLSWRLRIARRMSDCKVYTASLPALCRNLYSISRPANTALSPWPS